MSVREKDLGLIACGLAIGYVIPVEWAVSPLGLLTIGLVSGALLALMLVRL